MRNQSNAERPTIGGNRPSESASNKKSGSSSLWLGAAAVLSVLILGLAILNFQKYNFGGDGGETAGTTEGGDSATSAAPKSAEKASAGTTTDGFPDSTALIESVSSTDAPWVVGHQERFQYRLSGQVSSEDEKNQISEALSAAYGQEAEIVKNDLAVNPSLPAEDWVSGVPTLLKTLPIELIDGSFSINGAGTKLSGTAPAQKHVGTMTNVAESGGLPAVTDDIEVVDLKPPTVIAQATGGNRLELSGSVPDQKLRDIIEASGVELYGAGNVNNNMTVDEGTFARFPLVRYGVNLKAFRPLDNYVIRITEGELSADVSGGIVFAAGVAELTETGRTILSGFPPFINQFNRPVTIVGHTDDTGTPAENLKLSQDRANAVRNYLIEQGADGERITATGKGQDEPIASNDSPEGRQQNRRVEIQFGSAP